MWSFVLTTFRRCGVPTHLSSLPKTISSKLSELIVSSFFKSRCSAIWEKSGEAIVDTYHRRFGYVSPVAIPAVSVVLTGSWINLRVWAFGIFSCGVLFLAELNDLRIEIIFVLVAWIMSTLGKRLYQVLFLIFVFTCTFYAAPMETREPVA